MSYAARETGLDARPIEIYDIALPSQTFRLTSHDEDVTFDGQTYTASSISRSQTMLAQIGKVRETTISIARDCALAESLLTNGIPPIDAFVTVRRYHEDDNEARQLWKGYVVALSVDEQFARLRVPSRSDEVFDRGVPTIAAQRTCRHVLYSRGCSINEDTYKLSPTVSSVSADGLTIVVSSLAVPDAWAQDGKAVRATDGEPRSVLSQIGTTIVIDVPFRALEVDDTLHIFAGCDHTINGERGCISFNNVLNFGGEPELPVHNPSAPTGYGVVVQV